jgi:hypothetical protein
MNKMGLPSNHGASLGTPFWEALFQNSDELTTPIVVTSPSGSPISYPHIASALYGATQGQSRANLNYFRGYIDGREDYNLPETFLRELDGPDCDMAGVIERSLATNLES